MTKTTTDPGRKLYEEELRREPLYRATGKPRPSWSNLPEAARNSWRRKAENEGE